MNEHPGIMGAIPSSPETPTITEQTLKNQAGKVFLITGATSGIGFELAKILFAVDATIWITARSSEKAQQTISALKQASPHSKGAVHTVVIDFNDLKTIKPAVDEFLARETTLDVLFNRRRAALLINPLCLSPFFPHRSYSRNANATTAESTPAATALTATAGATLSWCISGRRGRL